jgi:ribosome-binding factor A
MSDSVGLEVEDVDLFQFVDVPFKIKVKMIDTATQTLKTGQSSTVKVLLGFEGTTTSDTRCREHHPHLLEVVSNTGIQDNGMGSIEVKITDVSMNHDHQRFVVYLEAYRTHGENNILLATTNPITCVRHKLVISESNSQPYIWYKDEGAKDKCIKVLVKLIDCQKNLVKERLVPLSVSLVYSSGQAVQPLSVLSIFNEKDKPLVINSNGSELIKFRVNEVSRNHRKQLFHLLVAPDTSQDPLVGDISPATSVAFEVKSKRTSDARKEHAIMRNQHTNGGMNNTNNSSNSINGGLADDDSTGEAIPMPQSRINELNQSQPLKRMKLDSLVVLNNAANVVNNNNSNNHHHHNSIGGAIIPPSLQSQSMMLSTTNNSLNHLGNNNNNNPMMHHHHHHHTGSGGGGGAMSMMGKNNMMNTNDMLLGGRSAHSTNNNLNDLKNQILDAGK